MSDIIKKVGEFVAKNIEQNPKKVRSFLNTAYSVSGFQMRHFPENGLLPHQKFAAVACNRSICGPLRHPEESAIVNIFLPCEMLQAANIYPLFAEGLSGYLNGAGSERPFINYAENYGIPKSFCSYHKTMLGAAFSGVFPKPKLIVNTTMLCDANNLTFRTLENFWEVPRFVIDVPAGYSKEAIYYVARQLSELKVFLEDITGVKITKAALAEIFERENNSIEALKQYYKLLENKFVPNTLTSEMYKVFLSHILMGTKDAEKYFKMMLEDIKECPERGNELRFLWGMVLPNWQKSIREIFNNSEKYQILCTNMNFDSLIKMDINHPFQSMAKRLLLNSFNTPAKNRAEELIKMGKRLNADGAVYFNHWGCKQTMGSSVITKEILEANGIPTLILDGDGCDRSNVNDGQMITKLQAFIEMLEAEK